MPIEPEILEEIKKLWELGKEWWMVIYSLPFLFHQNHF